MARTAEQLLKSMIGDLVVQLAQAHAEIEALREPKPAPAETKDGE